MSSSLRQRTTGFTLVEVMIVVAIIALLAAVSIPLYKRIRLQADESAAIAIIRTLVTAEENWRLNNPDYAAITTLNAATPPYITGYVYREGDSGGTLYKQKYTFYIYGSWYPGAEGVGSQNYLITTYTEPSGSRRFCAHTDGVIRVYNGNCSNSSELKQ